MAKFFKFSELTCTDCKLPNIPDDMAHVENLVVLCDFLDIIRDEFGHGICINSAFRTPNVNKSVNGAVHSLHMEGRAADIRPCTNPTISSSKEEANLKALYDVLQEHRDELTELILYPTFIHVAI